MVITAPGLVLGVVPASLGAIQQIRGGESMDKDTQTIDPKTVAGESAATGLEQDSTQFTNVMIDLAGRAWTAGIDTATETLAAVYDVLYPSAEDREWQVTPTLSVTRES
jgi:hypothetical protein